VRDGYRDAIQQIRRQAEIAGEAALGVERVNLPRAIDLDGIPGLQPLDLLAHASEQIGGRVHMPVLAITHMAQAEFVGDVQDGRQGKASALRLTAQFDGGIRITLLECQKCLSMLALLVSTRATNCRGKGLGDGPAFRTCYSTSPLLSNLTPRNGRGKLFGLWGNRLWSSADSFCVAGGAQEA